MADVRLDPEAQEAIDYAAGLAHHSYWDSDRPDGHHTASWRDCDEWPCAVIAAVVGFVAPASPAGLDAAYRERNAVVAALIRTNGWPVQVVMAPDTEGWWIVYAETPQGQVSWHVSPDDLDLFSDWPLAFGTHPSPWDGHTTEEKYRRLAALAPAGLDVERLARAAEACGLRMVAEWWSEIAREYAAIAPDSAQEAS